MFRKFFYVLLVTSLMLMSVGTAFASGQAISLVEVRADMGGGPAFVFDVEGEFTEEELNTTLRVIGGADFDLYCNQDGEKVVCHTSKKVAGNNVAFYFGGEFWEVYVPAPHFCVPVYDWDWFDGEDEWYQFDSYCLDVYPDLVAEIPLVTIDHPNYGDSTYRYYLDRYDCVASNMGRGYYYVSCPPNS